MDASRKNAAVRTLRRFFYLVGRARFELATNGLKVRCSTS